MIKVLIDRIASILQTHIDVVRNLENLALAASAGGSIAELRSEREKLRELRRRLISDLTHALELNPQGEDLLDLRALAGYYIEAGSRREYNALVTAGKVISVDEDLREIEEAKNIARRLIETST